MLTTSELKQVKHYLELYSKKDSQLPAVPVDLEHPEGVFTAEDYLAIVQDANNKIITIKNLEKVFLLTFLTDEDFREALKGKIPEEMLENACVTTEKLADGSVTTIKLGVNAVTTAKIATGAITGDKIANNTIQGSAFAANSITSDKIVDGTVTGDKLADGSIQSVDIKDSTLSGSKFVDGSISGSKIQDNTIESKHLLDNSIPASKIKDGSIESVDIKDGTLDGAKIKDNTIESVKLANNAITADKIIDNSVTTSKIANDAVTEDKIVDDSITTAKIANSSVTTDKIVDGAITEDKLANGAVTTAKLADGLISEIQNITDATPTTGSVKPVQSGGVQNELALGAVYDVSAKNPTGGPNNDGKWESLSALLSDINLNTIVPTTVRKGGMSIKFVQSSDNKYVQYRLMANAWSTTVTDWQGVDDMPIADSKNVVMSGGVWKEVNSSKLYAVASEDANSTYTYREITFKAGHTYRFEKTSNYSYTGLNYTLRLAPTKSLGNNQLIQLSRDVEYVDVVADRDYNYLLFYTSPQTIGGTLEVTVIDKSEYLFNEIQKDTTFATGENVPSVGIDDTPTKGSSNVIKSSGVYNSIEDINENIGTIHSKSYAVTAGTAINTTNNRLPINVPANTEVSILIDYPEVQAKPAVVYLYNGTSYVTFTTYTGITKVFKPASGCDSIGINIEAARVTESGTITVSANLTKSIKNNIEGIDSELSDKADKVVFGKNLFNKNSSDNITGYFIDGSGLFIEGQNYRVSHPIPVKPGESVYVSHLPSGTTAALYYDKQHSCYISRIIAAGVISNSTLQTVYLFVTFNDTSKEVLMVNEGETSIAYEPYQEAKVIYDNNIILSSLQNDVRVLQEDDADAYKGKTSISREYTVQEGVALNTTSSHLRHLVNIPTNRSFSAIIDYAEATSDKQLVIYFYDGETLKYSGTINNKTETEFVFDFAITGIGFYISAANAVADGTAQLTVKVSSVINKLSKDVTELQEQNNRLRLSDVLNHWLNGEKFPIGFQGDSTTDGTSTTGWKAVPDTSLDEPCSHPGTEAVWWLTQTEEGQAYYAEHIAQGESIHDICYAVHLTGKGRGKVLYNWTLAYPYLLRDLLRKELGNNNLEVYNIGYYGASLANNYSQLDSIYSDVYSDVKMVGIVLGINDRLTTTTIGGHYDELLTNLRKWVKYFLNKGITPFMVTNQVVTQCGFNPGIYRHSEIYQDYVQTLCNLAKKAVAKEYNLEVIDMNDFGKMIMECSGYAYDNLTEDLHFKNLGHKLEAGYLFSKLIPWVLRTDNAKKVYFGFNCARCKTDFSIGLSEIPSNDKFKIQVNTTQSSSTDKCVFDAYMFVNSKDGAYNVKYITPVASGYIVIDGDTSNPITIDSTEMTLDPWDIGLHHVQVYTGESTTVAFKGFLLEQQN